MFSKRLSYYLECYLARKSPETREQGWNDLKFVRTYRNEGDFLERLKGNDDVLALMMKELEVPHPSAGMVKHYRWVSEFRQMIGFYEGPKDVMTARLLIMLMESKPGEYTSGQHLIKELYQGMYPEGLSVVGNLGLEDALNALPEDEKILVYHSIGAHDNYGLVFKVEEKGAFKVSLKPAGETSGDGLDVYDLSLRGRAKGFNFIEGADRNLHLPRPFYPTRIWDTQGVLSGDEAVVAVGIEGIELALNPAMPWKDLSYMKERVEDLMWKLDWDDAPGRKYLDD